MGRWAAGVEGQGGSGVLPQAVSSRAARVAEVAQRMARKEAVTGRAVSVPAWGVRRRDGCMVMGVLPVDASLGASVPWMLPAQLCPVVSAYIPLQCAG